MRGRRDRRRQVRDTRRRTARRRRVVDLVIPQPGPRQAPDDLLVTERLLARLATVFAGIATTLATLGLYGLLAFLVARRRREIGLRLALRARPIAVARAVAADVGRAVCVGGVVGLWRRPRWHALPVRCCTASRRWMPAAGLERSR